MILIYSPTSMPEEARNRMEQALEDDCARVHYQGNDGAAEFVIMEAPSFAHVRRVEADLGLELAFSRQQPQSDEDFLAALIARKLPRSRRVRKSRPAREKPA